MTDYLIETIKEYMTLKKYSFYDIRKKLKNLGINLDKLALLKRIKKIK